MSLGLPEALRIGQLAFGFDSAVAAEMEDLETPAEGNAADQLPPMTLAGVFFAAEQCGADPRGLAKQTLERLLESR